MKIAVCLSGNLRTYKRSYKSLFSFLDGINHDIFLNIKHNELTENSVDLHMIYTPKQVYFSNYELYDLYKEKIFGMYDRYPNVNVFDMTNDLTSFIEVCDKGYDFVVRARYDSIFESKLSTIINNINNNSIYLPNINNHHDGYNDTFAVGSSKVMKNYFEWNKWLIENVETKFENFYPEILLREFLNSKNINVKFSSNLNTKIMREEYIGLDYDTIPNTSENATAERNIGIDGIRYSLTKKTYFNKPLKIHAYIPEISIQNQVILRRMIDGMKNVGETDTHIVDGKFGDYAPPHILITFGSSTFEPALNQNMQDMISKHKQNKNPLLVIETALIGRNHSIYSNGYFRVAWNGFMYDEGTFTDVNTIYPDDRWKKVQKELGVTMDSWKKQGKYILLIHQVNSDSSIRGNDFSKWLNDTINEIKQYTDRPIKLRLHPHPVFTPVYPKRNDIEISSGTTLQQDLDSAFATVSFTSGASIDSILHGVPVFSMHPGNMAFSVSNYILKNIESPIYPDRNEWINRLSYSQWSLEEIANGVCWNHMKTCMPKINRISYEYL